MRDIIESWGRGIQKIRESCEENGNEMAEYQVSSSEIMVIFHALHTKEESENTQDNTQENTQDDTQDDILTEKEKRILAICRAPKRRQEIVGLLGYKSIKSIKVEMEHLLNTNRLVMEIPDKPKSKNQKYAVVRGRIKKSL